MKILQRNLNRSTFVVWEKKRIVSVVRFKFRCNSLISGKIINLLAPEFFFILAHTVYKMWIKQEPNTLELWNKLHFEEKKNGQYIPRLKYSVPVFVE